VKDEYVSVRQWPNALHTKNCYQTEYRWIKKDATLQLHQKHNEIIYTIYTNTVQK